MLLIARQGITILRDLHASGFVHGDMHPGNLAFDETTGVLSLIDFGLSHPFVDPRGVQIPPNVQQVPSRPYAHNLMLLSHWHLESGDIMQYKQSRRDDLFRFACVLYALSSAEYTQAVRRVGRSLPEWIAFRRDATTNYNAPEPFRRFMEYTRSLNFDEQPNYNMWLQAFAA